MHSQQPTATLIRRHTQTTEGAATRMNPSARLIRALYLNCDRLGPLRDSDAGRMFAPLR
jgi:hypothetical protein